MKTKPIVDPMWGDITPEKWITTENHLPEILVVPTHDSGHLLAMATELGQALRAGTDDVPEIEELTRPAKRRFRMWD